MSKRLTMTILVIAVTLAVILAAGVLFLVTLDVNRYKGTIEAAVSDATGRRLTIEGALSLKVSFTPTLSARHATLANAPWGKQPSLIDIGWVEGRINLLSLLKGHLEVLAIQLNDVDVNLETDENGQGNWAMGASDSKDEDIWPLGDLSIDQLDLNRLSLRFHNGETGTTDHYDLKTLTLIERPDTASVSVRLEGNLNGQHAELTGTTGRIRDIFKDKRFPVDIEGSLGDTRAAISGDIGHIVELKELNLTVQASGHDLAAVGEMLGLWLPLSDRFDVTAHLAGNRDALEVKQVKGTLIHRTYTFHMDGRIGNLNALEGVTLDLTASGQNMEEIGPIIDEELPPSGPFDFSGRLIGSTGEFTFDNMAVQITYDGLQFNFEGKIEDFSHDERVDLMAHVSGETLAALAPLAGIPLPATGSFVISGRLNGAFKALRLEQADAKLSGDGYQLTATGAVENLNTLGGMNLDAAVSGENLVEFGRLFDVQLPETGPYKIAGQLKGAYQALRLEQAEAKLSDDGYQLTATGSVENLNTLDGMNLDATVSGENLVEFGRLFNVQLPETGHYKIAGRIKGANNAIRLEQAEAKLSDDGYQLTATGAVENLNTLGGMNLDVAASGENLVKLGHLFGIQLPVTDAFDLKGHLAGSTDTLALRHAKATAKRGHLAVKLEGSVDNLIDFSGKRFFIDATGKTLTALGEVLDAQWPDVGPFKIKADIKETPGAMDIQNIVAKIDQSDFSGWAQIAFQDNPKITSKLNSALVDLTPFVDEHTVEAPSRNASSIGFSDQPLPFDMLQDMDADIELNAKQVRIGEEDLASIRIVLRIADGTLIADTAKTSYKDSQIQMGLKVVTQTGSPPLVAFRFLTQDFYAGQFFGDSITGEEPDSGLVDIAADLRSEGHSIKDLMANLNGTISTVFGQGNYPQGLDLIAEDLSTRVLLFWKDERRRSGQLNCGVLQFGIQSGMATTEYFVFDSEISVLTGGGQINLATGEIDFLLHPQPKDRSLISLSTKLKVGGSIWDPTVSPDITSATTKGAKALSAFALGPAGLLAPFINLGARNKFPCDLQDLQNKTQQIFQKAGDVLSTPQ